MITLWSCCDLLRGILGLARGNNQPGQAVDGKRDLAVSPKRFFASHAAECSV